ncbi:MAG TPA: amidohydrolase [Anaerolineae bacterium]|nr:amidohydrolase [Anaerolineae bacterium]
MESGAMLEAAYGLHDTLVALRRRIHQHPELGFQELETARLVAETLTSLGLTVDTGIGKTGVVGHLGHDGPTVAIRADMDALSISEANDLPYASRVPGVMHACGHDAHTAMLLGAAMLLSRMELPGRVRLLFQPCEEGTDAEGKSGAMRMVDEGVMGGVDAVIALHVDPRVETGQVKVGEGPICAAADAFAVTIVGIGCHGAFPHLGVDPVFISAQVITAIQGIVSRRIPPEEPAVVTVGSIHGGTAANVIPPEVLLKGTIRSMKENVRRQLWEELRKSLELSRALGGDFQLEIRPGFPVLSNDAAMAGLIRQVATDLLGEDNVQRETAEMGAEDFSILASEAPGAMFSLGVKRPGSEKTLQLHSPNFDVDEEALPIGAAILGEAARRYLVGGNG